MNFFMSGQLKDNYKIKRMQDELSLLNAHILIVDDEIEIARLTKRIIESFGCVNVNTVNNWKDALNFLEKNTVDLTIMDIDLSSTVDGIDLVKMIKEKYDCAIIYLTGWFNDDVFQKAKSTYPSGYLLKPFDSNSLKAHIEIALHNQTMKQENVILKRAIIQTIVAMEKTVAMKDPYTSRHQNRVSRLAVAIGEEMGLAPDIIEGIRYAGLIHEYGKIFVPTEILSKPGKLSDVQFELIKDHPLKGYEALINIDFPWPIAEIILQHHERMDGSGYPRKLSGDDIMLEARIIAVADVVSSITSYKSYREAKPIKTALDEIETNKNPYSGEQLYDPDVVAACLKLFRENIFSF